MTGKTGSQETIPGAVPAAAVPAVAGPKQVPMAGRMRRRAVYLLVHPRGLLREAQRPCPSSTTQAGIRNQCAACRSWCTCHFGYFGIHCSESRVMSVSVMGAHNGWRDQLTAHSPFSFYSSGRQWRFAVLEQPAAVATLWPEVVARDHSRGSHRVRGADSCSKVPALGGTRPSPRQAAAGNTARGILTVRQTELGHRTVCFVRRIAGALQTVCGPRSPFPSGFRSVFDHRTVLGRRTAGVLRSETGPQSRWHELVEVHSVNLLVVDGHSVPWATPKTTSADPEDISGLKEISAGPGTASLASTREPGLHRSWTPQVAASGHRHRVPEGISGRRSSP